MDQEVINKLLNDNKEITLRLGILTDLVFKLLSHPPVQSELQSSDIMKIMGWSKRQFHYHKDSLKSYGLYKAGTWKMPAKGLFNYIEANKK